VPPSASKYSTLTLADPVDGNCDDDLLQEIRAELSRYPTILDLPVQAQVFNVANHPNYYVQNGTGVSSIQYSPFGTTCGDGVSSNQQCYLVPKSTFGNLQVINYQNGPRIMQFSLKWTI